LILSFTCLAVVAAAWSPSSLVIAPNDPKDARTLFGAPTVVDGDTLKIAGERIRLHGIDAPELRQTCADGWPAGDAARRALVGLVAAGTPHCDRGTTDRYGRTVAICRVNGDDIGVAMVRQGFAWAYITYSWRYLPEEWLAWFDGAGVHARRCATPPAWRADHRAAR
jgi:endonuclease YncB( thermonuclease family)